MAGNVSKISESIIPIKTPENVIFDRDHLFKQALGDHGLMQEILIMYEDGARARLTILKNKPSRDDVLFNLHALKGASAGVGALTVCKTAYRAEIEVRESGALSEENLSDIAFAVEEASVSIAQMLGELAQNL